jgi:hypothetical protein
VKTISRLSILLLMLLASAAQAQEVDATRPLRCALAEAAECDEMAACSDVTLEQIELPGEFRVDFAGKQLVSSDGQRTSPVQAVEALDAVVVLQGHQNGRGWTMVLERATGRLSATIATVDGAFILAGGCSAE